jgi:ribosomal protein S18 acetylase RimI-like enzyme
MAHHVHLGTACMMPAAVDAVAVLPPDPGCWSPLLEPPRVRYFKRYRMEIDLNGLPPVELPVSYTFVGWHSGLLDSHAEALYASFIQGIDTIVFPSLSNRVGCQCLMTEITRRPGFEPWATWLLKYEDCLVGTIQGIRERSGLGAIQNIGIVRSHRERGLGTALILQALHGFRLSGLGRAFLEVTAENDAAVRVYRRLGFRRRKTLYKAVEVPQHTETAFAPI